LLEYLLRGVVPSFEPERVLTSNALIFYDLQRQEDVGIEFAANVTSKERDGKTIEIPIVATRKDGKRFAIALSGPLTDGHPADERLLQLDETTFATALIFWRVRQLPSRLQCGSPSLTGTFPTCRVGLTLSVDRCKADIAAGRAGG
jgi:hypothetical protein